MTYTATQIHNAILSAAAQIEKNPDSFLFGAIFIPHSCGSPGCALGWIGHFLGYEPGMFYSMAARDAMGLGIPQSYGSSSGEFLFYNRMYAITKDVLMVLHGMWMRDAAICAKALRIYADRYHPLPQVNIPPQVRAIFDNDIVVVS